MRHSFAFGVFVAQIGRVALLAGTYAAIAKLSLLAAIPPGYATALWPPSGVALAAALLLGARIWPGIWLGAALVNITVQPSLASAALMATGNTLEALAGAVLMRRFVGAGWEFKRGEDVFVFIAIAAFSATVAATLAAVPLALVHALPWHELAWNWWTWWQGDTMGIILVAPLILSWCAPAQRSWTARRFAEGASLTVGLLLVIQLTFSDLAAALRVTTLPLAFLVLPFIMWAAVRFRQREVTTVTAAVSAFAIAFTVQGRGPFVSESLNASLLLLLAFMSTVAATGLVLNAVVGERARIMDSLTDALRQLREETITDPLTGLYNRRFLDNYLPRELARAGRSRLPVAVVMLDLDHFKRLNDKHGHAAGDDTLKALGSLLKHHTRAGDMACRYGGEEFLLVFPEMTLAAVRRKAESIRLDVEKGSNRRFGVTASLGIALFPDHGTDADSLTQAADKAMYEAKQAGRNRVVVSSLQAAAQKLA